MPLTSLFQYGLAACVSAVLIWAAYSDVRSRRIPNPAVLALLLLFIPWALTDSHANLVSALEAAAIGFVVTFLLYSFKIMGAGDSKLFAAVALFGGMAYLPYLALATSLVGGVIALFSLATRPQRALVMLTLRGRGDFGRGVPYGVAIAAGAILVMWATLLGSLQPYAYGGPEPVTASAIGRALNNH